MRRQGSAKKLTEAARLLARGELDLSDHDDDAAEDHELDTALAAFGLVLDRAATGGPRPFFLLPDNLRPLQAWLQLQTQWMRVGMEGTATGLNYAGVEAYLRLSGHGSNPRRRRRLLRSIQIMEQVTLAEWGERQRASASRR